MFRVEPLPLDRPLHAAPHVLLSPHAEFASTEALARLKQQRTEDLFDYLAEQTVLSGRLAVHPARRRRKASGAERSFAAWRTAWRSRGRFFDRIGQKRTPAERLLSANTGQSAACPNSGPDFEAPIGKRGLTVSQARREREYGTSNRSPTVMVD